MVGRGITTMPGMLSLAVFFRLALDILVAEFSETVRGWVFCWWLPSSPPPRQLRQSEAGLHDNAASVATAVAVLHDDTAGVTATVSVLHDDAAGVAATVAVLGGSLSGGGRHFVGLGGGGGNRKGCQGTWTVV